MENVYVIANLIEIINNNNNNSNNNINNIIIIFSNINKCLAR